MFIVHCQSDWGGIQVVYHFEAWKCRKQRMWNLLMDGAKASPTEY
jgi:hypothetical protein